MAYLRRTGLEDILETPGNRGARILRSEEGDECEFVFVSCWDSLESIRAFAGDDVEAAIYYREDARYLLEMTARVRHYQVSEAHRHEGSPRIQAALNGHRDPASSPVVPVTPAEIGREASSAVRAGASSIHVHVRDERGAQSIRAEHVAATVDAIRAECPRVPIGVSTGAWMEPSVERRVALIDGWIALPDFAAVNFDEEGAVHLAARLLRRGIEVEAGLSDVDAAFAFVRSGLAPECLRVLVEPETRDPGASIEIATEIENVLSRAGVATGRLLHGSDEVAWPLVGLAVLLERDTRIGLEDTLRMPDGREAAGNGPLVEMARAMMPGGCG